jgi:hypothetical protein
MSLSTSLSFVAHGVEGGVRVAHEVNEGGGGWVAAIVLEDVVEAVGVLEACHLPRGK